MITLATVAAKILLSVLVTLMTGVRNKTRSFFRKKEEKALVEARGGDCPEDMARKTLKRMGAAKSGAELQAENEIPSGPGEEVLFWARV